MKLRKLILTIVIAAFAVPTFASTQSGYVSQLRVRASDGLVYFFLAEASARNGVIPACASGAYWMIKDENSETGKKQYSMLLAAQLAGARVSIRGLEDCTRWPNGEDVDIIFIE